MNNDEETTKNFWAVFSNLTPFEPPVILRRLYYDDHGVPLFYSQEDVPGNYIDVTPEQYQLADMAVRVKNGKITNPTAKNQLKLMPSSTGTPCDPTDVSIVVDPDTEHQCWRLKYNDTN
jgi:hypothetical protein